MNRVIRIWNAPPARAEWPQVDVDKLLGSANGLWATDDSLLWMLSGFMSRAALETALRLRCREHGLQPRRIRPANQLFEAGVIDRAEFRSVTRLLERGAAAVHNHPFSEQDAEALFRDINDLLREFKKGGQP